MLVKLVSLFLLFSTTCGSSPGRHNLGRVLSANNRLNNKNVSPSNYKLELRLEEDFYDTNAFSGTVSIVISVNSAENEVNSFRFHAKDLSITELTLSQDSKNIEVSHSEADPETDIVTVTATQNLVSGDYVLIISYTGKLSESSMVGFYKSSYVDKNKNPKYLATTQFEETHARTAFPCFDEPNLKSTFDVIITYPKGYTALSNGGAARVTDDPTNSNFSIATFPTTPSMSTYLVAFIVSEFTCTKGASTSDRKSTEVCTRMTDKTNQVALAAAPALLDIMRTYTNNSFGSLSKMTLAAIPDFAPGAMENWGLVTFREVDLLWDATESSNADKQKIVTVIAHELSHQWFGDLVTLDWWSDVFLNEGFATFFQYHAAALYQDTWQLEKQFVIDQLQTALVTDSLDTALPLSYDVDNADYSSRFDDISYNKGGSVLRMVSLFLGDLNFKNGLADYISQNGYATATPEILWASFDPYAQQLTGSKSLPANMTTVMENWTKQPGYPVVKVSVTGSSLIVQQEQFSLSGDVVDGTQWYVPITYTLSSDGFADTSIKAWLSPGEPLTLADVLTDVEWVVVNSQEAGYYRVDYDSALWSKISTALITNISSIDELNRAQMVDDQLNFARAGRKTYKEVFKFLTFLENDDSYYTWTAAFNGFSYLLQRTNNGTVKAALSAYLLEQMKGFNISALLEEDNPDEQIDTLKQVLILTWACKLGHEECIDAATNKFLEYKSDSSKKPNPNLRELIYCTALKHSNSSTEDFRFLWQTYLNTQLATERVIILKALSCTNSAQNRNFHLSNVLTDDIRRQDATTVIQGVFANNPEGVDEVLTFLYDHYAAMVTYFGRASTLTSVINSVAEYIVTQKDYNRFETVSKIGDLDASVKAAAEAALERIKQNLEKTQKLESTFKEYFNIASSGAASVGGLAGLVLSLMSFALFILY